MPTTNFTQDLSEDFNFGVYPTLLEIAKQSFSRRPLRGPAFQLPSVRERAFSSTICIITCLQIENVLQRKNHAQGNSNDSRDTLLNLISNTNLKTAIEELCVIRDVIAHSHLYDTTINYSTSGEPRRSHNKKTRGDERKIYQNNVYRRKTKLLKFTVIPHKVSFIDSIQAVSLLNIFFKKFCNKDSFIHKIKNDNSWESVSLSKYIEDLISNLDKKHSAAVRQKLDITNKL